MANHYIWRSAFFVFYQDMINVSLPKKIELKVALSPTNYQPASIADIHIPVAQNHSVLRSRLQYRIQQQPDQCLGLSIRKKSCG
jgi:hypothetical protein